MHPRTLKRLAAAAFVLALILAALMIRERASPPVPTLLPKGAEPGKLSIRRPGDTEETVLVREGGAWRLKAPFSYPADAEVLRGLLEGLSKAAVSDVLSSNGGKHAAFQVNESSAIRFKAFSLPTDSEPLLDILVGARGADYDAFFFRRPGAADVREARGLGRDALDKEGGEWAERVVCAIDPSQARSVELRTSAGLVSLLRKDGGWSFQGAALSTGAVAGKVEPLLTALARLQADRVVPEKGIDPMLLRGLAAPEIRLRIRHARQGAPDAAVQTTEIDFGPKSPDFAHYARLHGRQDVVFRLSAWRLDPFKLRPADLRPGK